MSLSQSVWSLDSKAPVDVASLKSEKELEDLLCEHIELLNEGWLVIGRQIKTDAGKIIDILCMDHSGKIIVVELKKDLTPREVTAQVIDYAASVSKLTTEDFAQCYLSFSNETKNLNTAYREKYGKDLDETIVNNENVRMIIVAAKMDDGTERIIHFLRNTYQVDINILFFHVFQWEGKRFISRVWLEKTMRKSRSARKPKRVLGTESTTFLLVRIQETGKMPESMVLFLPEAEAGTRKPFINCRAGTEFGSIFHIMDMLVSGLWKKIL